MLMSQSYGMYAHTKTSHITCTGHKEGIAICLTLYHLSMCGLKASDLAHSCEVCVTVLRMSFGCCLPPLCLICNVRLGTHTPPCFWISCKCWCLPDGYRFLASQPVLLLIDKAGDPLPAMYSQLASQHAVICRHKGRISCHSFVMCGSQFNFLLANCPSASDCGALAEELLA